MKPFILSLFMLCISSGGFSQTFEWAKSASLSYVYTVDAGFDKNGNTIVVGNFADTVAFEADTLINDANDVFLLKYNSQGVLLWSNTLGGLGNQYVNAVDFGMNGNFYITGGGLDSLNAFIAKYDSNGNMVWISSVDDFGNNTIIPYDINVDRFENVYVFCTFWDTIQVGSQTLYTNAINGILTKYNSDGIVRWVKRIASNADLTVNRERFQLATDMEGNVYLGGSYPYNTSSNWYINISTDTLFGTSSRNLFIAKLDSSGGLIFLEGSTFGQVECNAITVDDLGNLFVSGHFRDTLVLGVHEIASSGAEDIYMAKYNDNGHWEWVSTAGGAGGGYIENDYHSETAYAITIDDFGNIYLTGSFSNNCTFGTSLQSSLGYNDLFIAKAEPNGDWDWVRSAGTLQACIIGITCAAEIGHAIGIDGGGNVYITGIFGNPYSFNQDPQLGFFGDDTLTNPGFFLTKLSPDANQIQGIVFDDLDNDSIRDNGEAGKANIIIQLTPTNEFFTTNNIGQYTAFAKAGNLTILVPNPPRYSTVYPDSINVNFQGLSQVDSLNDFALFTNPDIIDVAVSVFALAPPRVNRPYPYRVTYRNIGTDTVSGQLDFLFDSMLQYDSSSVLAVLSGDSLIWNYADLLPGEFRNINVYFTLGAGTSLGMDISSEATIYPIQGDTVPANNTASSSRPVTGSYDPNNKEISTESLTLPQVQAEEFITYIINFQNVGTDTAFTVVVKDTLDTNLNIPTFEMLSASHTYNYEITGPGIVEWTFNNIILPDSGANKIESHGFISYQIQPKHTLNIGDSLTNRAHIFFDENLPITTNTAITHIINSISIKTLSGAEFCIGDSVMVEFEVAEDLNPGNIFTVELSGPNGSFQNADTLAQLTSVSSGIVSAYIPLNAEPGNGYRLRVVASNPPLTGEASAQNFSIFQLPSVTLDDLPVICDTSMEYVLTGGSPQGGFYSGTGVTDSIFNPGVAGQGNHTISYVFIDSNGCSNQATKNIIVQVCTGMEETVLESLKVFPNPSNGIFNVMFVTKNKSEGLLQLTDISGRQVFERRIESNGYIKEAVDLSSKRRGIYFLKVVFENEVVVRKVVFN